MVVVETISSLDLEMQMSLLLLVAMAAYIIASKINQSAVIAEILVGIAVGPSLLGFITYTDVVTMVGHIGAVVLLFVVGLEFKIGDIAKLKYGIIAFVGVVVPWISGYFLGNLFGFPFQTSVFIGTALTATSIAITANVLKEMGKLKTEAAKAIIGAAVIDDVLGLLALSISGDLVHGAFSAVNLAFITTKAVAFIVLGYLIGAFVIKKAILKIDRNGIAQRYPEFVFIFAIMFAFLYSTIAELAGLSGIVGAFIIGVSLEGIKLRHSKHFGEGADYLYIIFGALFFVSLGILADVRGMTTSAILFLAVLTGVAITTKVVGCGIAAKIQGMTNKDSLIVGFGMSPRGEVAMIVAMIGLTQGVFGQDVYVSLVLMSLLTTILTPVILKNWLYKPDAKKGKE